MDRGSEIGRPGAHSEGMDTSYFVSVSDASLIWPNTWGTDKKYARKIACRRKTGC